MTMPKEIGRSFVTSMFPIFLVRCRAGPTVLRSSQQHLPSASASVEI